MGDQTNPLLMRRLPSMPPPTPPPPPPPPTSDRRDENNEDLTEKRKKQAKSIIFLFSVLTLGSGYILYICLRLLLYELAKRDILVTLRADGEIKARMRGDKCASYIMAVENFRIDPYGFDLFKGSFESYAAKLAKARVKNLKKDPAFIDRKLKLGNDSNPVIEGGYYQLTEELKHTITEANTITLFEEIFGVAWVGILPYRVFKYPFRWLKYGQRSAQDGVPSGDVDVFPRDEEVDSLFFRYPQYSIVIDKQETGAEGLKAAAEKQLSQVQVKVTLVFETETTNPQKTLFRTAAISSAGDWQQALVKEITDRARVWIGSISWDILTRSDKKEVAEALGKIRDEINGVDENGLPEDGADLSSVRDYGQKILKITMPKIDLVDQTLQTAYSDVFKSEKERDAAINRAAGARATAAAPVLGKADGLEKIGAIPGGKEMYMAEQIGKIHFYAPGREGLLYNISEEVTGSRPPDEKVQSAPIPPDDSGKKKS